jgi:hypothetical protein
MGDRVVNECNGCPWLWKEQCIQPDKEVEKKMTCRKYRVKKKVNVVS